MLTTSLHNYLTFKFTVDQNKMDWIQLLSSSVSSYHDPHRANPAILPSSPADYDVFLYSVNYLNKESTHNYSFALQKSLQKNIWLHMSVPALQTKVIGALLIQGSWQPHQINFIFHRVNWQWHFIWGTDFQIYGNLWQLRYKNRLGYHRHVREE